MRIQGESAGYILRVFFRELRIQFDSAVTHMASLVVPT